MMLFSLSALHGQVKASNTSNLSTSAKGGFHATAWGLPATTKARTYSKSLTAKATSANTLGVSPSHTASYLQGVTK